MTNTTCCSCKTERPDWCADCGQAVCEACWEAWACCTQSTAKAAADTTNPSPREKAGTETTMAKTTLKSMTKAQLIDAIREVDPNAAVSSKATKDTLLALLKAKRRRAARQAKKAQEMLDKAGIPTGPSSRLPDLLDSDTMAAKAAQQKEQDEAARKATRTSTSKRPGLTINSPVEVSLSYRDHAHQGFLNPDGTLEVNGTLHRSPSAAGRAVRNGQATNGYLAWTYQAEDGRKPIDALRAEPKGYATGGGTRRSRSPQTLANQVATKRDQVRRTKERLARQEEALAKLEAALAEAKKAGGGQADWEGDPIPQTLTEGAPEPELVVYEAEALVAMKVGPLRKLAKTLGADESVPSKKADLVDYVLRHQGAGIPA